MSSIANCPGCDKPMKLPEGSAGKRIRCSGCQAIHRIQEDAEGALGLERLEQGEAVEAQGAGAAEPCPQCKEVGPEATGFCTACGRHLGPAPNGEDSGEGSSARPTTRVGRKRSGRASKFNARTREQTIKRASTTILIVAILLALGGAFERWQAGKSYDNAFVELELFADDEALPEQLDLGDGLRTYTAGEFRNLLQGELNQIVLINGILVAVMLGCYFWSRRSPVPATTTALCIYLLLIVLLAVSDPTTIVQGILIKALIIIALINGIKAGLQHRAATLAEA